jgi:hypothetical protein
MTTSSKALCRIQFSKLCYETVQYTSSSNGCGSGSGGGHGNHSSSSNDNYNTHVILVVVMNRRHSYVVLLS